MPTEIDLTAVDSNDAAGTLVQVSVENEDNLVDLVVDTRATGEMLAVRLTVAEALATIAALTQAVQVAISNS